ncbi:ABC transporter permease [Pendulispora albinea]|uniref:Autoinducer 2 import system permease protein LsrD n=1 Tax=Pendulispora albinea TaxID=2741071 RepID=A0ABZ2M8T0_9BACT
MSTIHAMHGASALGAIRAIRERLRQGSLLRGAVRAMPVFGVLIAVLVWTAILNPNFTRPPVFLALVRFAVPLMLLAVGQLFVIVAGEFDLSVGSLVTAVVALAAGLGDGDPSRTWWLVPMLVALGAAVGLINGLVTAKLGVPSFIATLGMMLVLSGAVLYWTGGAMLGYVPDNLRAVGRGNLTGIPWIERLPYAVIVMVVVLGGAAWLRHGTDFGHRLVAVGSSARVAALSGVNVARVRITAFVVSSVLAVIAGIVLGGIVGVSPHAGLGYEFQAISAAVLGGAVLGGGRGAVVPVAAGALALQAIFSLLNLLGVADPVRHAFQGAILIGAVALSSYGIRRRGS